MKYFANRQVWGSETFHPPSPFNLLPKFETFIQFCSPPYHSSLPPLRFLLFDPKPVSSTAPTLIPLPPGIRRKAAPKLEAEWAGPSGHIATHTFPHSLVLCAVYPLQKSCMSRCCPTPFCFTTRLQSAGLNDGEGDDAQRDEESSEEGGCLTWLH